MWFGTQSDAKYGAYHSVYDSFDWVARQGDPGFRYHVAMSQVWGLLTLRLADAATVPYNYTMQAEALKAYLSDVQTMATKHEKSVDWSALEDAIGIFRQSAEHASVVQRLPNGQCLNKCQCNNDSLAMVERGFLIPDGLVGRKWFKHALQAPSLETGYGSDVFPAVMDSIRKRDDAQIKQSVDETAVRVKAAAVLLGAMCYADKENLATSSVKGGRFHLQYQISVLVLVCSTIEDLPLLALGISSCNNLTLMLILKRLDRKMMMTTTMIDENKFPDLDKKQNGL
eukprot:jgi/Bigna1/87596/estExt_fgenesh1_pg.C_220062